MSLPILLTLSAPLPASAEPIPPGVVPVNLPHRFVAVRLVARIVGHAGGHLGIADRREGGAAGVNNGWGCGCSAGREHRERQGRGERFLRH